MKPYRYLLEQLCFHRWLGTLEGQIRQKLFEKWAHLDGYAAWASQRHQALALSYGGMTAEVQYWSLYGYRVYLWVRDPDGNSHSIITSIRVDVGDYLVRRGWVPPPPIPMPLPHRVRVPTFEVVSNPTIPMSVVRSRRPLFSEEAFGLVGAVTDAYASQVEHADVVFAFSVASALLTSTETV